MAEQKIYIGSHGPFLYDDADPIDDADGDFAGESYSGIALTGQAIVETAPSQANNIARKNEVDAVLSSGLSATIRVITNVQLNGAAIEVKYKDLTFTAGIITAQSAESAWTATPL